jgi:hypothetical protein
MLRVIAEVVVPLTKPAGFRKSGLNLHRRRGESVQVLGFRMILACCTRIRCEFSCDLGLAFDSMCELAELPVLEKPKEYECDGRGTRGRLEGFIPGTPELWSLRPGRGTTQVARSVQQSIAAAIEELDRIDAIRSFARHRWFGRYTPAAERACVFYLLGDLDSAAREVKALAAKFHDRQNACRADWWVEELHLDGLRSLKRSGRTSRSTRQPTR